MRTGILPLLISLRTMRIQAALPLLLLPLLLVAQSSSFAQDASGKITLDLPGFEQGDLYLLSRLPNEQLLRVERSEWVWVTILLREGLQLHHRKEALAQLVEIRKSDLLTQILLGLKRAEDQAEETTGALNDLANVLLSMPPSTLKQQREKLVRLATEANHARSREAGFAALILADGDTDRIWHSAQRSDRTLTDFLNSIPGNPDPTTVASLGPKVREALRQTRSAKVREAALLALATIPGDQTETFTLLASFIESHSTERDAAIEALLHVSPEHWPPEPARNLIHPVVDYLKQVDPTARNTPEFKRARQLCDALASLLPAEQGADVRKFLASVGVRTVTIRAVPYSMKYDRVHMVVKAGNTIEITLENPDAMSHNLVIVMPGALEEVGVMSGGMSAHSKTWNGIGFVPDSKKVIAATPLVKTLESQTITVVAPEVVGEYPYVCTFPGHWASMNGILHVVEDVDKWIAENPVKATGADPGARAFVKDWKPADFEKELEQLDAQRSVERGKTVFLTANCAACHRLGDTGPVIGPELGEVAKRLTAADMLVQILEPSKVISDQYRTSVIELKDDTMVSGVITKQDAKAVYVQEHAHEGAHAKAIARDQIVEIQRSEMSTMPMGLLSIFNKDEILDLLAYIRSPTKGK